MGMFFFRVAPGVRLRFTSTGMRVGLGPRAARLHIGDGGLGVSTGAGPFAYYHSLSGRGRGGSRGSGSAAMERMQRAMAAAEAMAAIARLHQQEFVPIERPIAPVAQVPPLAEVVAQRVNNAVAGIAWWRFGERRRARRAAREAAPAEHAALVAAAEAQQRATQSAWDDWWARLCVGDPDVTLGYVNDALDDNESPGAAVECVEGVLSAVVHVPAEDVVPERGPALTEAGNPTTRVLPRRNRAGLYAEVVYGHVLLTLREIFTVAPGVHSVRLVALRAADADAQISASAKTRRLEPVQVGGAASEVMLACATTRERMDAADWSAFASDIIDTLCTELVVQSVLQEGIGPIDISDQPDLRELLTRIEG